MFGILYFCAFLLFGVTAAMRLFDRRCLSTRVWLGMVLGGIEMMWFPSLFAFYKGFTLPAQQYALCLSGVIAVACTFIPSATQAPRKMLGNRVPPALLAAVVIPVTVLAAYLQYTHTLREIDGALYVGQSTYGDLCMHLSFATGLIGQSYPPEYTLLPGTTLGYPFLADALSATMMVLGTPLSLSFIIPGTLMTALIAWGFVTFAWELTAKKSAVVVACLLLFLNGGLGFIHLFDRAGADSSALVDAFMEFYRTPTNMGDKNIYWVNALCDLIIPQRTLMAGWMCVLPALYLLVDGIRTQNRKTFVAIGVFAGALPMIHTHSFLALGLLSFGAMMDCLIRKKRCMVNFLIYGLLAVLLALPQLLVWTFPQSLASGSIRLHFNWINNSNGLTDGYLWFWVKNVGPVFLLFLPAALNARKSLRPLALGVLCLFVAAECVLFQPNSYDNNKLFFIAFLVMLPITADFMIKCLRMLRGVRGRYLIFGVFMLVSTVSGSISIARECVSNYQLFSASETEAAEYIARNTPKDAVVLTSNQHNNPVASLTGRKIVCGSSIYLFYHGLKYSRQQTDQVLMLSCPEAYQSLYEAYGVDYIFVSSYERAALTADWRLIENPDYWRDEYRINLNYIIDNYPLVYECGEWYDQVQVFAVSARAQNQALNIEKT